MSLWWRWWPGRAFLRLTLHALVFLLLEIIFGASSASQLLRPGQDRDPLEYAGSFGDEV